MNISACAMNVTAFIVQSYFQDNGGNCVCRFFLKFVVDVMKSRICFKKYFTLMPVFIIDRWIAFMKNSKDISSIFSILVDHSIRATTYTDQA